MRELREEDADPSPFNQFRAWFQDALAAIPTEPNAMVLATATNDGRPSARTVLLKGYDELGFVFYTSYESRKGRELSGNPQAAAVFLWIPIRRQVRIEGRVEQVPGEESDAYFQSRPGGSRLSAWASRQSRVIAGRQILDDAVQELAKRYEGQEVPRPTHWGGYRLIPASIEFWQGRPDRLHDRLRYHRIDGEWLIERLSP